MRSGRITISDPLFIGDRVDCAAYDLPARNGTWRVDVVTGEYGEWGARIAELHCRHSMVSDDAAVETLVSNDIGVDAATVCVYDSPDEIEEAWSSEEPVALGPHGACSMSGIGDGTYTAYGLYEGDDLVAVRVVYIPDALGRMPSER